MTRKYKYDDHDFELALYDHDNSNATIQVRGYGNYWHVYLTNNSCDESVKDFYYMTTLRGSEQYYASVGSAVKAVCTAIIEKHNRPDHKQTLRDIETTSSEISEFFNALV